MRAKMTISILMSVFITAVTGFASDYIGTVSSIEGVATVKDASGNSSRLQLNVQATIELQF